MARAVPPPGHQDNKTHPNDQMRTDPAWDVELLRILVSRTGTQVEAQWAIHPQLKQDLLPNEWQEVNELMAKATDIVGNRFSKTLANVDLSPRAMPDRAIRGGASLLSGVQMRNVSGELSIERQRCPDKFEI